uniref:Uncharacterized protein n=1 Tax=Arundo donax TaxID=35708 RepID=A0A0A9DTK2_ARUDO
MSNTAILRSGYRLDSELTVAFIFLLKFWESLLSWDTHPLLPWPNSVIAAGRQPSGGSDVTPMRRAPMP